MATAKHKFEQKVFNPANQMSIDFFNELQKLAEDTFGFAALAIIEHFIYGEIPPLLKKSINQAHLENVASEQIVSHLEGEIELKSLEALDEMQINTVAQQATKSNLEKPKPSCHQYKKPVHRQKQCRQLKKEKDQKDTKKMAPVTTILLVITAAKQTLTPTTTKPSLMATQLK